MDGCSFLQRSNEFWMIVAQAPTQAVRIRVGEAESKCKFFSFFDASSPGGGAEKLKCFMVLLQEARQGRIDADTVVKSRKKWKRGYTSALL